jgi:DNA (cytosine-5)-methyltransferase 1
MDFSNKTCKEMVAICKEMGVKGYSGKTKEYLVELLKNFKPQLPLNEPKAPVSALSANNIKYIDLFSGLGAFHTAFNTSPKFECMMACDIDEGARNIYEANYGMMPFSDIREINANALPPFDLLCAGFPCQPFSIAGKGEGFNDKIKGNLFYDILRIIDANMPKMCILENVKNLKTHDDGNTYKTIETELIKRGYLITSEVINSADYGSPQARQRIFIVATKDKPFVIPTPIKITNPVSTIVDPMWSQDELNMKRYTLKCKPEKPTFDPSKPQVLYDVYPILSHAKQLLLDEAKIELVKKGGDPSSLEKGGRQGERVYSSDAVGVTVCASSGGPGAKTGLYKIGETIRRLNVKETLGMFGFSSDYKFPNITYEDSLYYLGNSIVVDVPKSFVPAIEEWFL